MAAKSSSLKKWLAAGLIVSGLSGVGFLLRARVAHWLDGRRICEQPRTPSVEMQWFYFTDTRREPYGQQLDAGKYVVTVTSDCYSAECSFEVLDRNPPSLSDLRYANIRCQGDFLRISTTSWDVQGFYMPLALYRPPIHVRLRREGSPFYEGRPGQGCPEQGFCVYPEMRD